MKPVFQGSSLSEEDLLKRLRLYAAAVEKFLSRYLEENFAAPKRLLDAMAYSLNAGGKRIRPALCLAWAETACASADIALPFAAAIEMIHTYSLIHDDLPAMDNDDLRRGKPSCHCAFDEATAILAGDALLTDAIGIALQCEAPVSAVFSALKLLVHAAGSAGMVGGQELDMQYTDLAEMDEKHLAAMQSMKTGAMIKASCVCGAILAGGDDKLIQSADNYGSALGKAFQIADDILDLKGETAEMGKPAGSDAANGKLTWPALAGLEESEKMAFAEAEKAISALEGVDSPVTPFLYSLAEYTVNRRV